MKYAALLGLLVCTAVTLSLGARAQDSAPKEHTMTGCLAKGDAPNTYKLTNVDKVQTVGIVSSSVNLAPHVGHKVDLTGTAVPAKQAETDATVPKAPHYMKITALKMESTTCP